MTERTKTNYIVIHASATPAHMDIGLEEIRRWHTDKPPNGNGWSDVGYHDIIKRDGTLEFGREENDVGAHAYGYNRESVGICMVGGCDKNMNPEDNFTKAQFSTLRRSVRFYLTLFPSALVVGHCELNPDKSCPCFDVGQWLKTRL